MTTSGQANWPRNSAEVHTPVARPRCSKVSEPSAQDSIAGSSRPLPRPVTTAATTTAGTVPANPSATSPTPERAKAAGTVTAGPSRASRPKENAPTAVPSELIALTAPIVPVDSTPIASSVKDSSTIST